MTTDSFLATMLVAMVAMFFGFAVSFAGYRLFMVLLPIWGFVFGFILGGQTIQAIFGGGFLATVTGWVFGFVVAAIFAVLSYMFYFLAVGIIAGSLGYLAGISFMSAIGSSFGVLNWIVAIVLAVILIIATYALNIQKWVVIIATAAVGAGMVIWTMLLLFYPAANVMASPVKVALDNNIWLLLLFLVIAVCGFVAQYKSSSKFKLEEYNRYEEY